MSSQQSYYIFSNMETTQNQLICVVCGSNARGYNFGAITCMSCKMFFRRHALISIDRLTCYQGRNCRITIRTRRYCSYCRLMMCFRMGMRKDFIRKKKEELWQANVELEQPIQMDYPRCIRPLDLLQWSDRSQLSNNDWLLLRQLSSHFDSLATHIITKAHDLHYQLSSIGIQPLKIRVKASYIYEMANTFADVALEFLKSVPQFLFLPALNKQALLMRNTRPMIMFHSHYQMNMKSVQNLTQTPYWIASINCILLTSARDSYDQLNNRVGEVLFPDSCIVKLILIILAFSANNIDHDERIITEQLDEYYHTFLLYKIQNMYIELLWKYMIYRFGEERAMRLFSEIIKTILRVQYFVFAMDHSQTSSEQKFDENIAKITDQTLKLNLENEL